MGIETNHKSAASPAARKKRVKYNSTKELKSEAFTELRLNATRERGYPPSIIDIVVDLMSYSMYLVLDGLLRGTKRVGTGKAHRDRDQDVMDRGKIYVFDVLSSQWGNPNRLRATESRTNTEMALNLWKINRQRIIADFCHTACC